MKPPESKRSLLWRLGIPIVCVQILACIMVAWVVITVVEEFNQSRIEEVLSSDGGNLEWLLRTEPKSQDAILSQWHANAPDVRLTLIDAQGKVQWDSDSNPHDMENHGDRPEIVDAMKTGQSVHRRYSTTLGEHMTYVARHFEVDGVSSIIRVSMRSNLAQAQLLPIIRSILVVLGVLLIITLTAVAIVSRNVDRDVRMLSAGAQRFAAGDFSYRVEAKLPGAFADLGRSLERIAQDQGERIRQLSVQQSEMQGILFSMGTGVIALDVDANVISVNPAAARILSLDEFDIRGLPIDQIGVDTSLIQFAKAVTEAGGHGSSEIILDSLQDAHVVIKAEPIHDEHDRQVGMVLVLDDVTRLRRLEAIRTDFASNVSHELRTPITAIQGYAELLVDEQDDAKRRSYVDVISRNAIRLSAIIEDLLSLSRIENTDGSQLADRDNLLVHELLDDVVRTCGDEAANRDVILKIECDEPLTCHANWQLLEQAVSNLVVNAIRYGPSHATVRMRAWSQDESVHIAVEDEGPGIDEEFRGRLFERFYRIDRGRSREVGGTGLGLAIVKHIILAHGGAVYVESTPGEGSVFTVTLPVASEHNLNVHKIQS